MHGDYEVSATPYQRVERGPVDAGGAPWWSPVRRLVVTAVLVGGLTGCSFLVAKGPNNALKPSEEVCSESLTPHLVDSAATTMGIITFLYYSVIYVFAQAFDEQTDEMGNQILVGASLAIVGGFSAIYGKDAAYGCRRKRKLHDPARAFRLEKPRVKRPQAGAAKPPRCDPDAGLGGAVNCRVKLVLLDGRTLHGRIAEVLPVKVGQRLLLGLRLETAEGSEIIPESLIESAQIQEK